MANRRSGFANPAQPNTALGDSVRLGQHSIENSSRVNSFLPQDPSIFCMANKRRSCYAAFVDEGRKRVIGIMAAILAARKLAQYDGGKRVPATMCAIADAIRWAEEIMKEIDSRWPAEQKGLLANLVRTNATVIAVCPTSY
jgi:hypothetical protein